MKNNDDAALLAHKHKVDAERRELAIARRRQEMLRLTAPGVATPGSIKHFSDLSKLRKAINN